MKKMPLNAQAAAVRALLEEGHELKTIRKRYKMLADGVDEVEREQSPPARAAGSGSMMPITRDSVR